MKTLSPSGHLLVLALLAAGCAVQRAPESPPPDKPAAASPASAPAALAPFLVPLSGTEPRPDDAAAQDLARIAAAIGEAPLVGLGEGQHGVHELHRFAHRLFAYLAEHKGFEVYALEVDLAHAALLDDYVKGRRDDLDALLARRHPWAIFYDQALRDLLLWMRQQNLEGRHLSVAGYDHKQPAPTATILAERLRRLDPAAATEAERLFARIETLNGFGVFPNVSGYNGYFLRELEPQAKARQLVVRLRSRGQGVDYGRTGLLVDTAGGRSEINLKASELSEQWREHQLTLTLPATAKAVRFLFYHRGNGTVWHGGLEAEIDGQKLDLPALDQLRSHPLLFPARQVMDYRAQLDPEAPVGGAPALRIEADPRLDDAKAAARELRELVEGILSRHAAELSPLEAEWTRQLCRLIEQALDWRILVEPNRDVFLAENLSWLREKGFPGQKILALAHTIHSQELPQRMGAFLAEKHGDGYFTVSLLPLSGSYRYDGPPSFELRVSALGPNDIADLGRRLEPLQPGDFLLDLAAAGKSAAARDWLKATPASPQGRMELENPPDLAIFVRNVTPLRLLDDGLELQRGSLLK